MWSNVGGEWKVLKMYKGVSWENINWSVEGHVGCPYCTQELGRDRSQDNFTIYGLDDNGLPNGGHCWSCNTTIVSASKILADEENKTSGSSKITSKLTRGETGKTMLENNMKLSKDEQKLKEKRFTQKDVENIYSETFDELKCFYRGLDKDICSELGIRWTYDDKTGKVREMFVPTYVYENGEQVLTGYKVRVVRDKFGKVVKDFYTKGFVGKINTLFGETKAITETVIICEGEVDLVTIKQALKPIEERYKRNINVVTSLLGSGSTVDAIKNSIDFINKHKKIILCLDTDDAGQKATKECLSFLPREKLFTANLRYKDPNEYVKNKSVENLAQDVYWSCTPVVDYGVKSSRDLLQGAKLRLAQDKILFPMFLSDFAEGFTDKSLWLGEWVNWISSISSGKSTVFDAWMVSWALDSPYRQAILSYESDWKSFGVKIASLATARAVLRIEGKENRLKWIEENEENILRLLQDENGDDRFDFVDGLPTSVNAAKELFNYLVKIKGVKVLWIDPMVDLLSICQNKQEYDSLVLFLDNLRMTEDVTIMCSMHTRKNLSSGANGSNGGDIQEEDIYGGREVIAKGTINITAQRNKNSEDWIEKNTMILHVRKSRNDGGTGMQSKLFYRSKANRLYPYSYAESKDFFQSDFDKKVEDIEVNDEYGFCLTDVGIKSFEDNISKDEKIFEDNYEDDPELPF